MTMQYLPRSHDDDQHRLTGPYDNSGNGDAARKSYVVMEQGEQASHSPLRIERLIRKYWRLALAVMALGASIGFVSVVLSSPMYRTRLMLEVLGTNGGLMKGSSFDSGIFEANEVNIQTQINILRGGSFLKRGEERLQSETVPLAPTGRDIFSRLRQRIRPASQDPQDVARRGLNVAMETFDARPINHTRLIELSCESTSPDVAAEFLNSMAAEFVEDAARSRTETAQKTSEWVAAQTEETKQKLQESEEHLREFVAASGNVFAGQDLTLEDTKLVELKGEVAKIQNERIARQTRYELTQKNPPESLAEVLDNAVLRTDQAQLDSLKRDKAALETIYTSKNDKVKKVDAQIGVLEKSYQNELESVVRRIKNDYEASLRQEKLLSSAYASQSQKVGSEAGKAAQYSALKREVENLRQMYNGLLVQQNEASLNSSVPVNPIRIVEASALPVVPYKPRPMLNISLGAMLGLVFAGALVFLKEHLDRSIQAPGVSRRLFNTPELGVIPNLGPNGLLLGARAAEAARLNPGSLNGDPASALTDWQNSPAFITESFRGTLASILRTQETGKIQKAILITSPGPAEGKTTVIQNLGIALAETGRKVLLVDADFRRPHLHRKFNLPNEWGLIDLLSENRPLNQYLPESWGVATGFPGLSLLANRTTPNNVSKALYSPRLRAIMEILIQRYDMVLVDSPPILNVADTRVIAPLTDGLILVLRCGVTSRESAVEAYQRIQEDGLALLGTVLTDYDFTADRKRQYYYDYDESSRA
jgi:succinoglycan biosynthesis transport protein ExoP